MGVPKRVLRIAKRVRAHWEQEQYGEECPYSDETDLAGYCGMVSASFLGALSRRGIKGARLKGGEFFTDSRWCGGQHCWVEFKGQVIDLTATQFGRFPKIYMPNKGAAKRHYKTWQQILKETLRASAAG